MDHEDFNKIRSCLNLSFFSGKVFLITGATGMLASYMIEFMLQLNKSGLIEVPCTVVALVRSKSKAKARFLKYQDNDSDDLVIKSIDICERINLVLDNGLDYIIHAASPASPRFYGSNPVQVILPNVLGTKNTLDLALKYNVKSYLFFSSGEVYGEIFGKNKKEITENDYGYLDPVNVRSCYAESKRIAETLCVSYLHQYDVPARIVRPFHTYGPGMRLDDGRAFADFVKNVVNSEDIVLNSDGSARRPFCYIADATIAFFKVLFEGVPGEAYNVANPDSIISIGDLAKLLVKNYPEKNINVVFKKTDDIGYIQSEIKEQYPNIDKIKSLGWTPTTSLVSGFKKTIGSFQ